MSIETSFKKLEISSEVREGEKVSKNLVTGNKIYQYIDIFKNPAKLPINQIHIEHTWRQIKKHPPKDWGNSDNSAEEMARTYIETKSEIIPALDRKLLPPTFLHRFEPFSIIQAEEEEERVNFITKNIQYLEGLEFLLNCNFHQFWCTILNEPSAVVALRSFLLEPILPYQFTYLVDECLEVYMAVLTTFLLVYEKLLTFKKSETEYMASSFGLSKLIEKKLLNLPIVITLAVLYKDRDYAFVDNVVEVYFNYLKKDNETFLSKEVEVTIDQNLSVLEIIGNQVCGFGGSGSIVPNYIHNRPAIFSLSWVYSVVDDIIKTLVSLNALFQFYRPSIEMALNKNLPFRLPYLYVNIYKDLFELLDQREEEHTEQALFKVVIKGIGMGRTEFIEVFHVFVSNCLDEALKHMGDNTKQEHLVETYLKLLTTALEEEYFIKDYNKTYDVANQNEMIESCCDLDPTRTKFIVSCINRLPRDKVLQELSKSGRRTLEDVIRDFTPALAEIPKVEEEQPCASGSRLASAKHSEIDAQIQDIIDMFPHLGDGFALQCLEAYNFQTPDVINAILEDNLPPHLVEIPFDSIRIPPEPEPEKPILAYRGKKPDYDDALKLLNDKKEKKDMKTLVLDMIQSDNYNYDDDFDEEGLDMVDVPVHDNPTCDDPETEIFNPNRRPHRRGQPESDSEESEEEAAAAATSSERNRLNFCDDPAAIRERRNAKFASKHPQSSNPAKPKPDVVGKAKGQGQEKSTQINRQKKNANKSSRANHNRKSGATWKRNKGMIPS
ncbi:unnamed protein product [Ceutorhynchus assimilis]|uniref:CUE domain-containing protein n=1 Tax=Ceutorhynchus assimilis TaxID=467358 RepID=A0A9N9MXL8_9CUCU|nr:unnamed protein product [Ceutorhynchus assimilis]